MSIRSELNKMMRESARPEKPYEPPAGPPDPWDEMPLWAKGLDVLSRPNYASASFAKALLTGANPFKAAVSGFTGENRTTYSDVLKVAGMDPGLARATLGFAGDVLLDPTTYVTFGAGAGKNVVLGGVSKTLTKAGTVAHEAMAAAKSARLAELIPKLAQHNPEALERLLTVTGLTGIGKDMAPDLLAKVAGKRVATQSIEKAATGKAVPAGIEALIGKTAVAKDLVQSPALRFMGAEIPGSRAAIQGVGTAARATYGAAEKIPVIGKAFTGARIVAEKTKAAAKAVFSTSTGLPEVDRLVKQYSDILDYKTLRIVSEYKEKIIGPMKALRKKDPKAYERGLKEINTFLEGVVQKQTVEMPDTLKIAEMTKQVDQLSGRLADMEAGIQKFDRGAIAELEGALKKREKDAVSTAKAESREARQAFKAGPGELLKELKDRGIKRVEGIAQAEYAANVPKALRKRAGVPMDEMIQELTRRNLLPPNATQEDLYKLLGDLQKKPRVVTTEDVLARMQPTKGAANLREIGDLEAKIAQMEASSGGRKVSDLSKLPSYVKEAIEDHFAEAEKRGLVDKIEDLSSQRKTAKEIAAALKLAGPESADMVRAVRAKLGIPSMDDATEFGKWLKDYSTRSKAPMAAVATELQALKDRLQTLKAQAASPSSAIHDPVVALEKNIAEKRAPLAQKKAALEAQIAASKNAITELPPIRKTEAKLVQGPLPVHPDVAAAAQFIKNRFDSIWRAEQAGLALPPNKMEFYLPHYMKGEVRDALIEIINSDARKLVRPEFVGRLSEAMRRTATGKVDEILLPQLVESGLIDPSKARELLAGRGVKLTGDDLLVFENNPIKIALNRELRSIRALNSAEMAKDILESPVFLKSKVKLGDVDAIRQTLAQHPDHALFVPTKSFIEKFKTAAEREAMYLGKDKAISGSFIQEVERILLGDIAKDPTKAAVEAYIIPREVAHHLSKAYSLQFDEKALTEFFRTWDKFSGWWKTFATAVRPGFHVRNEVSNMWQLMLAGVRSPEPLYKGLMVLSNPQAVADIGAFTGKEVKELAEKYGVLRTGFVGSDIEDLIRREIDPSKNPLSTAGPLARTGAKVGSAIEDHARLALFIDQLQKGADPAAAAMTVKKYMFDYRDLTRIERGIFRRIIPFYAWTRKSIPLAIETTLTKPGYAAALGKLREAGEENVEDPIKNEYVASWIKEGLGVPIRKTADGKTEFFLLKGWVPMADLAKLDVEEAFGMLHPAIKTPIELAMNRNVYSGQPIERFPGQEEKFVGIPMRAKAAHIIRNIVFMQELDRTFFREEFDAARSAAGTIGFRTYKQDKVVQMRSRVYDLQHQMGDLKNVISLATKRHGADSGLVKQAEERLHSIIAERDRVKAETLELDPEAFKTKKPGPPKEEKLPMSMQGFRRSIDLGRLLRAEEKKPKAGGR